MHQLNVLITTHLAKLGLSKNGAILISISEKMLSEDRNLQSPRPFYESRRLPVLGLLYQKHPDRLGMLSNLECPTISKSTMRRTQHMRQSMPRPIKPGLSYPLGRGHGAR
jgi:hypothetical protein